MTADEQRLFGLIVALQDEQRIPRFSLAFVDVIARHLVENGAKVETDG